MSTLAQVALGTVLSYWDGTSWVEIAEVTSIDLNGPTREVIDVGKLNTTDEYMNKLQGMLNGGDVSVSINYVEAGYETLRTHMETRGNKMYQIALPNGEGLEFEGFLTELPMSITTTDAVTHDASIAIDGEADFLSTVT